MNLWQRENENSLICQNFQIEAHNSTEAKTETGSSTAEPGRGKEMGHVFSASHFQLVLFSNKELKIKICRTLWLAKGNNIFSVFQLTVCQVVRGNREGLFTFGKVTHPRYPGTRFMSPALAQLRSMLYTPERNKEFTKTSSKEFPQRPVMLLGIFLG